VTGAGVDARRHGYLSAERIAGVLGLYIVIERVLPLTQETDLLNQGAVYPAGH
jgi:hypothetical protein